MLSFSLLSPQLPHPRSSSPFCNASPSQSKSDPTSMAIKSIRSPPPQGQRSDESRMTRIKMELCSKQVVLDFQYQKCVETYPLHSLFKTARRPGEPHQFHLKSYHNKQGFKGVTKVLVQSEICLGFGWVIWYSSFLLPTPPLDRSTNPPHSKGFDFFTFCKF